MKKLGFVVGGRSIAAVVLCAASFVASASTWYVDASHYDANRHSPADYVAAGYDGTTAAKAFGAIQIAVDAATAEDTVKVLPGTYNQGVTNGCKYQTYSPTTVDRWQQTRVLITKKLTIESTGGKEVTRVEGWEGTNVYANAGRGYILDGITCFMLTSAAKGSVIRGFTCYRGWPQHLASKARAAGGVCMDAYSGDNDFLVTDCTFDYCFGRGAGGIAGGTAIRCLFTRCVNEEGCNAAYGARLYNCIATRDNWDPRNGLGNRVDFMNCTLVNCTGVNNYGSRSTTAETPGSGRYYNCVFYANQSANNDPHGFGHKVVQIGSLTNTSEYVTSVQSSDVAAMTNLCVCPARGDYAPVMGGLLDGTGDRECLAQFDWIPAEEINKDFNGNAIAADSALPIGAVLPPAEVKSGYIKLSGSNLFDVDGEGIACNPTYIQSREWPCQVRLGGISRAGIDTAAKMLYISGGGTGTGYRSKYNSIVRTLPPPGFAQTDLSITKFAKEYFVGGDNASDSNDGLSANAPLATISAAVAKCAALANWTATLVHVAPGRYGARTGTYANEPGDIDTVAHNSNHRASINIPSSRTIMLLADEGPAVTFIEGAPDPASSNYGCGPNAIRALSISGSSNVGICNFTIRNGYSSTTSYSEDGAMAGGAGIGGGLNQQFIDCVFTENHGYSAVGSALCTRCVFSNNTEVSTVAWNVTCSSCIFSQNRVLSEAYFGWGVHSYNCSVYDKLVTKSTILANCGSCNVVNMAADYSGKFQNYNNTKALVGSVISAADMATQTRYSPILANPFFTRPKCGDFRLHRPSEAIGAGVAFDDSGVLNPTNEVCRFIMGDIENRLLAVGGRINAGAVGPVTEATCCYIDPVHGNDANEGFTEDTALRTLQAAMESDVHPRNDVFVALPGTYAEGSGIYSGRSHPDGLAQATVRCRVVLPENAKLISRDGPEKTIIVGAPDMDKNGLGLGLGPNAIRCAFVESGAVLSGFTLTGGRSDYYVAEEGRYDKQYQDNFYTGGVLGRSYDTAICENCIITNNIADLGGSGGYIALHGCFTGNNIGYRWGGFLRYGKAYNTFVGSCCGEEIFCVSRDCINCTFYGDFTKNNGSSSTLFSNVPATARIWNNVIIPNVGNKIVNLAAAEIRNLVLPKGNSISGTGARYGTMCTNVYTLAELQELYPNGYPADRNAPSVDTGYEDALAVLRGDQDAAFAPRISNGALDMGAFEYDWTGDYAAAMNRRVTVTEASPNVVEDGNGVLTLTDEGVLKFSVAGQDGRTVNCSLEVTLAGSGKIRILSGGVVLGELTSSGKLTFPTSGTSSNFVLDYVGEGSASFAALERNIGFTLNFR